MNVTIYGKEYEILDYLYDYATNYDIVFNEEYFDYLSQYKNPFSSMEEDFVSFVSYDLYNRLYMKKFGSIICICNDKLQIYGDFISAFLNNVNNDVKYYFYNLLEDGFLDYNYLINDEDINNNKYVKKINSFAKIICIETNGYISKKDYNNPEYKEIAKNMSYDEYILQQRKYMSFRWGFSIHNMDEIVTQRR